MADLSTITHTLKLALQMRLLHAMDYMRIM